MPLAAALLGTAVTVVPTAAIASMGAVLALIVPPGVLLFISVVLFRNLGFEVLRTASAVTIADGVLLVWTALQLARAASHRRRIIVTQSARWLTAFLMWAWLVTLAHGVRATPLMRVSLYAVVSMLLVGAGATDRRAVRLAVGIYAAIEIALNLPVIFRARLIGVTIGDPQTFGLLLLACLALLLGHVTPGAPRRWGIAIVTAWTLATVTRGIWFALGVMIVCAAARRLSFWRLALVALVGGAAGLLLFAPMTARLQLNAESAQIRERSVERGLSAAFDAPITGHGWAWDQAAQGGTQDPSQSAYNLFLNVTASLGLVGLVLIVGYFARLFGEIAHQRDAVLFCASFLALSLVEMTIYAGALGTLLFFLYAGFGATREPQFSDVEQDRSAPTTSPTADPGHGSLPNQSRRA